MTEIRNRAWTLIGMALKDYKAKLIGLDEARLRILSIPELTIVDRKAELPKNPFTCGWMPCEEDAYNKAQQDMQKAGWVKEALK